MNDPGMMLACRKPKRIGFALESQGEEPPVTFTPNVMHSFSYGADEHGVPQTLDLFGTVVWLDMSTDPDSTTEGYPWRDYTRDQTVTVHQTTDLEYVPLLPDGPGSR